jgi:hypothetical protein
MPGFFCAILRSKVSVPMKKWLKRIFLFLIVLFISISILLYFQVKDRHPGYHVDVRVQNNAATELKVGFSAIPITPVVVDRWTDVNNDAKFIEADGDTYEDLNGNGVFDAVWIAGFSNKRAANGIHDDLWARTIVFDDGISRLALTSIDAIGFMHDDIVDVRKQLSASAGITYSVISSTHTHEAPDLLGLWGDSYLRSGVDQEYMDYVKKQTALSIERAAQNAEPAILKFAVNEKDALTVVNDTREPHVFDEAIRLIQVMSKKDGSTLGTLVSWGNHPETLWSANLLISSDFPHFLREGIEKGIYRNDSLLHKGLGGVTVYFNAAVGGLMTTNPVMEVTDIFTGNVYKTPDFDKTKAQGDFLAYLSLQALDSSSHVVDKAGISISANSIDIKMQNPIFRLGAFLGVLKRGMNGWMKVRSEVAAFSIGPAHFITVPGEIYPEIVNGGVESPDGQDYPIAPLEVPPLRSMMRGEYNFIFGMANDMIGYIIPKSQWDTKAPYTYGRKGAPYGEINSLGPETAPTIHSELKTLLEEFYK